MSDDLRAEIDSKIEELMNAMEEDDAASSRAASVIAEEILSRSDELNDDVKSDIESFCNQIIEADFNRAMSEANHARLLEEQANKIAELEAEEAEFKRNLIEEIVNFKG